ncbi:hypothetical protein ENKO_15940 [Enterobacter kobei]|uniref:Uncharacterized protein n=1 Tax=Enterobacter kobei TaxID=208224 RepID=A0AA86IRF8_9ENTR|nr:hypothetical protein ENKO_15940 [Enterobacter kobei]
MLITFLPMPIREITSKYQDIRLQMRKPDEYLIEPVQVIIFWCGVNI